MVLHGPSCACLHLEHFGVTWGGYFVLLLGFHASARKSTCLLQKVETGRMVRLSLNWEWGEG